MHRVFRSTAALALAWGAPVGAAAAAPVTDVAEQLAAFEVAVAEKKYDVAEAQVAALAAEYASRTEALAAKSPAPEALAADARAAAEAERRRIEEAVERVLKSPRGAANLQQAIVTRFGRTRLDGERLALRWLKLEPVQEIAETLAAAVSAVGAHRDPKQVDLLLAHLRNRESPVINAAAEALGGYFGEKEAVRKKIVGALVLAYESAGSARKEGTPGQVNPRAVTDLDARFAVRDALMLALARLTGGVQHRSAEDWAQWYRANKDRPWRDGVDHVDIKSSNVKFGPAPTEPPKKGKE